LLFHIFEIGNSVKRTLIGCWQAVLNTLYFHSTPIIIAPNISRLTKQSKHLQGMRGSVEQARHTSNLWKPVRYDIKSHHCLLLVGSRNGFESDLNEQSLFLYKQTKKRVNYKTL